MGERISPLTPATNVPPAWHYNPTQNPIKRGQPAFSIKQKLGSSLVSKTKFVPGPDAYSNNFATKKQAPKFGFGTCQRGRTGPK